MAERWVLNASPLITLSKIDHQHLLKQLTAEILVPQAVLAEINAGPADDPARQFLAEYPYPVVEITVEPLVSAWDLGAGESAVLSYPLNHPEWKAVVDDGAARRAARALDISVLGTLGIIIRARQANLIPAALPALKALQSQGFRLDEEIICLALKETVGEDWL